MKIELVALALLALFGLFVNKLRNEKDSEGVFFTSETGSSGHELLLPAHAIPFGEDEEAVLWTGEMEIEFSYQEEGQEKHHKMMLERIVVRETRRLFLEGFNLETGEEISFRRWFITSTIKAAGENWQEDSDFLASLGINVALYDFWEPYTSAKSEWDKSQQATSLLTLWSSEQPVKIEFAYQSDVDQGQRNIELSLIQQDVDAGQLYFTGFCKDKGEACTFNANNIVTKIGYDDKTYSVEGFITDRLRAELSAA